MGFVREGNQVGFGTLELFCASVMGLSDKDWLFTPAFGGRIPIGSTVYWEIDCAVMRFDCVLVLVFALFYVYVCYVLCSFAVICVSVLLLIMY